MGIQNFYKWINNKAPNAITLTKLEELKKGPVAVKGAAIFRGVYTQESDVIAHLDILQSFKRHGFDPIVVFKGVNLIPEKSKARELKEKRKREANFRANIAQQELTKRIRLTVEANTEIKNATTAASLSSDINQPLISESTLDDNNLNNGANENVNIDKKLNKQVAENLNIDKVNNKEATEKTGKDYKDAKWYKNMVNRGDYFHSLKSHERNAQSLDDVTIQLIIKVLKQYDFQVVQSESEADFAVAQLSREAKINYFFGDDTELFCFGVNNIAKNIYKIISQQGSSLEVEVYSYPILLRELELTSQEFREVCILAGTSYTLNKIKGVGIERAYKEIKKRKTIEASIKANKFKIETGYLEQVVKARNIFESLTSV